MILVPMKNYGQSPAGKKYEAKIHQHVSMKYIIYEKEKYLNISMISQQ